MSITAVAAAEARITADLQEKVLIGGDLARLTPAERLAYYSAVCDSVGLNPLTRPFEYIQLNGKLTLYARKDCTDQLRDMPRHAISVHIEAREVVEGVYVVTARAKKTDGRCDESIGAVAIANLQGEAKANAMMKAETKAKRRVTLSICGLGMLDETEVESIPEAKRPVRLPSEILAESERSQVDGLANGGPLETPEKLHQPIQDESATPYLLKVGRQKGQPITDQSDENLQWAQQFYDDNLKKYPNSAKLPEWTEAALKIEEEKAKR